MADNDRQRQRRSLTPGMTIPWKTLFWAGIAAGLMWWAVIYGIGIWLFW